MRAPEAAVVGLFVGVSYLAGPLFSEAFAAGPVRGGNGGRPISPRPPRIESRNSEIKVHRPKPKSRFEQLEPEAKPLIDKFISDDLLVERKELAELQLWLNRGDSFFNYKDPDDDPMPRISLHLPPRAVPATEPKLFQVDPTTMPYPFFSTSALEAAAKRHEKLTLSVQRRTGSSWEDAEDAVQKSFLDAYRKANKVK